ncbi:MAG: FAD:protein FMN transferase [Gammaproteobacteria bacterium]|jgi:thiamine biosynthesis lipoprotein|nr:MAG: FAD:protein FMN transferase [Gammaproteobacteria bacterium]
MPSPVFCATREIVSSKSMRNSVSKMRIGGLLVLFSLLLVGCERPLEYDRFEGATMGTYYRVTALCPRGGGLPLQRELEAELERVNAQMSTYQPDSELMRFNASEPGVWVPASSDLVAVIAAAKEISRWSEGAFDVTVSALVDLWGFGPGGHISDRPSEAAIAELLGYMGDEHLEIDPEAPSILRRTPLQVDLSAIAKGHGVDRLGNLLQRQACEDFLVDIGGEVKGQGVSPSGRRWRVGVEVPDPARVGGVQKVLPLDSMAVATSGDYRNFLDLADGRYSHTLDPRTGYPVRHDLASVSVLHPSAMWADGLATALNVLGPDDGFDLAEERDLAAFFLIRRPNGFEERYTSAMAQYLEQMAESSQ